MGIQFTLALLKPDLFGNPKNLKLVQESIINTHRLSILDYKVIRWTSLEARSFYAEHDGRTFQNRLVTYMSSGPFLALILSGENAIVRWRQAIGPTKVTKAFYSHPEALRAQYGMTDTRNSFHGSDSTASAKREISFIWPEFAWDF